MSRARRTTVLALAALASGCGASPGRVPAEGRAAPWILDRRVQRSGDTAESASTKPSHAHTELAPDDPNDLPADDSEPALFRRLTEVFGREGEVEDGVYRLVTPRPDLFVTMDGLDVPTGAFLEHDFRFWRCPCGKALVNGQFVVADYEANDVVDELHEGHLHVVTIAPLLLHEKPRLLMIRFQGEGPARELAAALKSALSYTGEERHKPEPADISPRR